MKYQEQYKIEFTDCDENEHLRLSRMADLMLQVSEHQLVNSPAGTQNMMRRGLGWVVTQYHFDIERLPQPGETVQIQTEASGYNRYFEYRDFMIKDDSNQTLVSAKSQWVMFDLKNRTLVPCDVSLMQHFKVPLLSKMPRFKRIRALADYDQTRQYRVRFDDLDTNHHLTNSHYFNWFIDSLDRAFLKQHQVKTIEIKFNKEVKYGQTANSQLKLVKDNEQIISFHALTDQKQTALAVCEITWKKETGKIK